MEAPFCKLLWVSRSTGDRTHIDDLNIFHTGLYFKFTNGSTTVSACKIEGPIAENNRAWKGTVVVNGNSTNAIERKKNKITATGVQEEQTLLRPMHCKEPC